MDEAGGQVRGRPGAVLFTVCAALFLVVVDVTVLHVAAPVIGVSLQTSATELLWIVDVYPLVIAPLLLVSGVAADRFGRKRLLMLGLVIFVAASIPAAFAPGSLTLIFARAAMAVGAAMIMPATMTLLRVAYPDRSERLRAVGIWSAVSAVGAAIGPLLGGLLVEYLWWGAVFLINVPLGLIVLVLVWRLVHDSWSEADLVLDALSVLLSIVAVLALVFGIKEAAHHDVDVETAACFATFIVATWWFIQRQRSRQRKGIEPLLNVSLFTEAKFSISVLAVLLTMFSIVGLDLLFAQYLQTVLGLTPVAAALWLAPMAVATVLGALLAHRIVHRFGSRFAIAASLGLAALALVPLLTLDTSPKMVLFIGSLMVVGFVLDIGMVAANDNIISAVPEDYVGQAAGVEEVAYDLGGGLGIAILGSVLTATYTATFSKVPGVTDEEFTTARQSVQEAHRLAEQTDPARAQQILTEAHDAFLDGLRLSLSVSITTLVATAIAATLLIKGGRHTAHEEEPATR